MPLALRCEFAFNALENFCYTILCLFYTHLVHSRRSPIFFFSPFGSSILYYFWIFSTIILNGVKYSCWKSIFTCKNMQISRFKHKFHKFHKLIRAIISNLSVVVVLFLLLLSLSRSLRDFWYGYAYVNVQRKREIYLI